MDTSIIVIDNFLQDADKLREAALMLDYKESESYKGFRAVANLYQKEADDKLQQVLKSNLLYVGSSWKTHWTPAGTPEVVHCDPPEVLGDWGAVLYLTPNAPIESGTALFRHKATQIRFGDPSNYESSPPPYTYIDTTKYEQVDYVANIYNRLIVFDGSLLHSMVNAFGYDKYTARMTQLWFIRKAVSDQPK